MQNIFFLAIIGIVFYGVVIYLIVLVIKALRKYLKSTDVRKEKAGIKKSLGETLKEHHVRCKMTHLILVRLTYWHWPNYSKFLSKSY